MFSEEVLIDRICIVDKGSSAEQRSYLGFYSINNENKLYNYVKNQSDDFFILRVGLMRMYAFVKDDELYYIDWDTDGFMTEKTALKIIKL